MKKATRQQTKNHNALLVLKTIYERDFISRAEIARLTHLTRPTVSTLVAELIKDGLVKEVGHGQSQGGKPPIQLSLVDNCYNIMGIDLSGSIFRGGIFDLRGQALYRLNIPTNAKRGEAAIDLVYELIDQLLAAKNSHPLLGIGIGTPGITDTHAGVVHEGVKLGWVDLPLRDMLETRYETPVHIANDSHTAALGEYFFRHGGQAANMVVLQAGAGISAGIVLNGRIHTGDHFSSGEIGHVMVVENGEQCSCGHFGCLETVASSRAILQGAAAIMQQHPESPLAQLAVRPECLTTDLVLAAFQAGDEAVRQLIADVGQHLGTAVSHLISILDIEHLIIAGRIARYGDTLIEAIRRKVHQSTLTSIAKNTKVELSPLAEDIVILGAIALILSRELGVVY